MKETYERARAAGVAARAAGTGVIRARFVMDGAGLATFELDLASLDFKALSQVALAVGTPAAGRALFELYHEAEDGEYDALFDVERFSDFKAACTARLERLQPSGVDTVRRQTVRFTHAPALTACPCGQVNVKFKLVKVADASDASAARNVDLGRKRLHYGTVRQAASQL